MTVKPAESIDGADWRVHVRHACWHLRNDRYREQAAVRLAATLRAALAQPQTPAQALALFDEMAEALRPSTGMIRF